MNLDDFYGDELPPGRVGVWLEAHCGRLEAAAVGGGMFVVFDASGQIAHTGAYFQDTLPHTDGVGFTPVSYEDGQVVRADVLQWMEELGAATRSTVARYSMDDGPDSIEIDPEDATCSGCIATYITGLDRIRSMDVPEWEAALEAIEDITEDVQLASANNACYDNGYCALKADCLATSTEDTDGGCLNDYDGSYRFCRDADGERCTQEEEEAGTNGCTCYHGRGYATCALQEGTGYQCCTDESAGDCWVDFVEESLPGAVSFLDRNGARSVAYSQTAFFTTPLLPMVDSIEDAGICDEDSTPMCIAMDPDNEDDYYRCGTHTTATITCSAYNAADNCPDGQTSCYQVASCGGCNAPGSDLSAPTADPMEEDGPRCEFPADAVGIDRIEVYSDTVLDSPLTDASLCAVDGMVHVKDGACLVRELEQAFTCSNGEIKIQSCYTEDGNKRWSQPCE